MTIDVIHDQLKMLRLPVASAELETVLKKSKKSTEIQ